MKMWSLVKYSGKIIISLLLSLMILAPVAILYDYKGVMVTCEDGSTEVLTQGGPSDDFDECVEKVETFLPYVDLFVFLSPLFFLLCEC